MYICEYFNLITHGFMMLNSVKNKLNVPLVLFFAWLVYYTFFFVNYWDYVTDDTRIFFRFAENIASGKGIVWNVSDGPVESVTSPLYLLLFIVPTMLKLNLIVVAKILNVIFLFTSIYYLYKLLTLTVTQESMKVAAMVAILIPFSIPEIFFETFNGMETTLFLLFTTLMAFLATKLIIEKNVKLIRTFTIVCFVAFLCRPEGAMIGGILLIWIFLSFLKDWPFIKQLVLSYSIFFVVPFILYMGWRVYYFHDIFPTPYYVKAGFTILRMHANFIKFIGKDFFYVVPLLFIPRYIYQNKSMRAILIASLCVLSYYSITNATAAGGGWNRYYLITMIYFKVILFYSLFLLIIELNLTFINTFLNYASKLFLLALTILIPYYLYAWQSRQFLKAQYDYMGVLVELNKNFTIKIEDILKNTNHSVLIRDAGQGYYLKREVIDLAGLTDAYISKLAIDRLDRPEHEKGILDYIYEKRKPDVFLLSSNTPDGAGNKNGVTELFQDERFQRDYTLIGKQYISAYSYYMIVALRKDLPDYDKLALDLNEACKKE